MRMVRCGAGEAGTKNGRAHAIGWAVLIIAALAIVRFSKGAGDPPYGVDASYYFQLARHVMRGEGLVTTVSLYHEGWVVPAKTPIYPLWPLLLGYTGRVIGLERAADLLPRLFYVLDLGLLYFLARAIALRIGALRITEKWWMPDSAHWIVAIFGLAPRFFGATTHPYTEGLAFAMALSSFIALERFEHTRGLGAAALSGLFAGLAFLARTQMVGVAVGCFLALALFAIRDSRTRIAILIWSVVAIATITPWLIFIGYIPNVTPMTLPRVELPRFPGWSEGSVLGMRLGSFRVMFSPSNAYSYVQSFGIVTFLVPLAAIAALFRKKFGMPRSLLLTAVFIAGVFFFLNLMLYHSEVWMPWLFGWRHGLPFIFLIALAVPWLVMRAGRFAWLIAIVLLVSVVTNASSVAAFIRSPDPKLSVGETELVQWLNARPVSAIATNAQILGSMSDAHLYWTYCDAPAETTKAMLRLMPVEYVILAEGETQCPFAKGAGPMRVVKIFGEPGRREFVLRPLQR